MGKSPNSLATDHGLVEVEPTGAERRPLPCTPRCLSSSKIMDIGAILPVSVSVNSAPFGGAVEGIRDEEATGYSGKPEPNGVGVSV